MGILERIRELRTQLNDHNRKYYVENAPEISDFEFDLLLRELQELEAAHPEYADPNSPTVRVGSDITSEEKEYYDDEIKGADDIQEESSQAEEATDDDVEI